MKERTELILEELLPLRSVVFGMLGPKTEMAETKKWGADFRKLKPTEQLSKREEVLTLAQELAGVLQLEGGAK